MSKGSFANEDVMEEYLSALLTDEQKALDGSVQRESVARLLEKVDAKSEVPEVVTPEPEEIIEVRETISEESTPAIQEIEPQSEVAELQDLQEGEFQAMFFEVAGLTMAVPLVHLGGIHNLEKPGPLFGKPDWFMGVMLHREEKLNVVDSAKWVMPEKCNEILAESLNYQYLIMLDNSQWGLACESLVNTVTLRPEDVKWRSERGKRPWLAGMVKEKMCALLDVRQLIAMLDKGLGSNEQ